jgi:hypothetical protein
VKAWAITIAGAITLAAAWNTPAQLKIGSDISTNLQGQLAVGYADDYGNQIPSDHGLDLSGNLSFTGTYYNPNFLSFAVNPYFGQSRANSESQSISTNSGVLASVNLFSGSNFPGSISYSKTYDSLSTFGLIGYPNYATHGNGDGLNIGWGVNVPNLPSLALNYSQGSGNYSIYGTEAQGSTGFHNVNVRTNYTLDGWRLNGGFGYYKDNSEFPQILSTQEILQTSGEGYNYFVGATHELPWHGVFSANYSRSNFDTQFGEDRYTGDVNSVTVASNFHPISNLTLNGSFNYTNDLLGTLYQTIINAGGILQTTVTPGQSSDSYEFYGNATYKLGERTSLMGTLDYRDQSYYGISAASTTFTGGVSHWRYLWGGTITGTLDYTHTTLNTGNYSTNGFLALTTYTRHIDVWTVSVSGNYSLNGQTALVGYTTSGWGYSANAGRKFGSRLNWSAGVGGSQTLLNQTGYHYSSHTYNTGLNIRWFGITGSYAQANGTSLLLQSGITPPGTPIVEPLPLNLIMYGGHSYGGGIGLSPLKHLTITGSYSRAFSNTTSQMTNSNNENESVTARIQWQFRQLSFNAGYSRFVQGFSATGLPPANLSTVYAGVSRWFNFF